MLPALITILFTFSCRGVLGEQRLIVTSEEELSVFLPALSPGCDQVFNVTTSEGLTAEVEDPNSLILLETIPRRNVGETQCELLIFDRMGSRYIVSEDGNLLVATEVTRKGEIRKIWEFPIPAEGVITALKASRSVFSHLLFILFQTADSHFEVHLVELPDVAYRPSSSIKLDILERHLLTSVLLSITSNFTDYSLTLALAGHSDKYDAPGRNSIVLYRMQVAKELVFLSEINTYAGISLNIVSMQSFNWYNYVLDSALGLLEITELQGIPQFTDRIDLSGYGELISIRIQLEHMPYIVIVSALGLITIDQETSLPRLMLENSNLCGMTWNFLDMASSEQFFFTTGVAAEDIFFQVIPADSPTAPSSWRLSDFIPSDMINSRSHFQVYLKNHSSRYIFIRNDKDALRVFQVDLGSTKLRMWAHSTGEFSAVVTGTQRYFTAPNIFETFVVESISPTNSTFFLATDNSRDAADELRTYTRTGRSAKFRFHPKELFSGPDLHLSIELMNVTEGATVAVPPLSYPLYKVWSICNVSRTAHFAATGSMVFALDNGELVVILDDLKTEKCRRVKFDGMKILQMSQGCDSFSVFGELESGEKFIASLNTQNYQLYNTIRVAACDWIRPICPFIACFGSNSITITFGTRPTLTITAEELGLASFNVTDALFLYSDYSMKNYLYISCFNNGLFSLDFDYDTPPKFAKFIDSKAGKLSSVFSYLSRVAVTGEIAVFDLSYAPEVRLIRTLPAWSADAVTSVFEAQSYIWVQKKEVVYVYDVAMPVHSSLVTVIHFAEECKHLVEKKWYSLLIVICENDDGFATSRNTEFFDIYQSHHGGLDISMEISAEDAIPGKYRAVLEMKAENSFGAHAREFVAFELVKE